jgi:hypothetical protein
VIVVKGLLLGVDALDEIDEQGCSFGLVPLEYSIDRLICAFASSHGAVLVG